LHKTDFNDESDWPLEIRGFEAGTAQDVFALTRALDKQLEQSLEADGYVQRQNIVLSDGQIVDGWVKL
jgi:hypothetical protein